MEAAIDPSCVRIDSSLESSIPVKRLSQNLLIQRAGHLQFLNLFVFNLALNERHARSADLLGLRRRIFGLVPLGERLHVTFAHWVNVLIDRFVLRLQLSFFH